MNAMAFKLQPFWEHSLQWIWSQIDR